MGTSHHHGFKNYDRNQSAPIGRSNVRETINVSQIILDDAVLGGVKYGPEIPATKGGIDRKVRFQGKTDTGSMPHDEGRWRFEVQIAIHEDCPIQANWESILAGNAASATIATARFKGPNKKKERPQKLNDPVRNIDEYLSKIDDLTYDLWESGNFITAGLFVPPNVHDENARIWSRGEWFHSACEDFDQCVEVLLSSDRAKELIQFTNEGTLRVGHPKAADQYKKLHKNTIHEGNFFIHLAIKQAIAGVERKPDAGDSVMKQAEYLYKNHMFNKNKKVIDDLDNGKELRDQ